jgi:uncharacterized membrane protein (GlpM family)
MGRGTAAPEAGTEAENRRLSAEGQRGSHAHVKDLLPPSPLSALIVLVILCLISGIRTYDRLRREGRSAHIAGIASLAYTIVYVGGLWLVVHTLSTALHTGGR